MTENLFILCREANENALRLQASSQHLFSSVTVLTDNPNGDSKQPGVVFIPDEKLIGLEWLTSKNLCDKSYTAWARALYHAMQISKPEQYVWFMEDDVAFQEESLRHLMKVSQDINADFSSLNIANKADSSDWYWWEYANTNHRVKSFNPLCRCSHDHLMALKQHWLNHGFLGFHEVCLPSIASTSGLHLLDWSEDVRTSQCFGEFRFRPVLGNVTYGICHPVKNPDLHAVICELPITQKAVVACYVAPFEFEVEFGAWAISRMEYRWLARWCREEKISKVLEFGPGASSFAFLGVGCELHSYESDAEWYEKIKQRMGVSSGLELLSSDTLPDRKSLPFQPDLLFIDGPPYKQGEEFSRRKECQWAMELCGRFFLHDSKRSGENATLEDYLDGDFDILQIPSQKGLALVTDLSRFDRPLCFVEKDEIVSRYEGLKKWGWYLDDFLRWQFWLKTSRPVRALEIGAFDGVSSNVMLDALFTHPDSIIDCIDPYEPDPTTPQVSGETKNLFFENRKAGNHESNIRLHEGRSAEVLSWMMNEPEHYDSYDFIYIDGSHLAPYVLTDAVLCWNLLKRGGVLMFDDYGKNDAIAGFDNPRRAIDAFLQVYGRYAEVFEKGWRLGLIRLV